MLRSGRPFETRHSLDRQSAREYRVSRVGQFTIAASVLKRWGLTDGGAVGVTDLEQLVELTPFDFAREEAVPYRVSSVGQMTLPAQARERWGLKLGGKIVEVDTETRLLVTPLTEYKDLMESHARLLLPSDRLMEALQ